MQVHQDADRHQLVHPQFSGGRLHVPHRNSFHHDDDGAGLLAVRQRHVQGISSYSIKLIQFVPSKATRGLSSSALLRKRITATFTCCPGLCLKTYLVRLFRSCT